MNECKVIAICNQKGGIGKSSLANAMSVGLARKGYKVLLVDMDPQGNASMSMGVTFPDDIEDTIASLMLAKLQERDISLSENFIHENYGVDFVVGNDDLGKLERMLSGFRDSEYILDNLLSEVKHRYDFAVLDTMPSIGNLTENAIVAADEILIPSEPQYFSTKGIQSLFDDIGQIQQRKNPKLKIAGILPTKVDMRTNITKEFIKAVNLVFKNNVHIFNSYIPMSVKLAECNDGKNIYEYDKNGKGVQAYLNFIDEYLERQG